MIPQKFTSCHFLILSCIKTVSFPLSSSSVHSGGAGRVEAGRGIGLRFPRYIRDREDKKAELATTAEQIVEMFHNQGLTSEGGGAAGGGADDDDDWL